MDDRIGIEVDEPPHLGGQHLRRHEAVERRLRVARILHTLPENPLGLRKKLFREFPHIIELQLAAVLVHHAPEFLPILRRERPIVENMEHQRRLRMLHDREHRCAEELRIGAFFIRDGVEDMDRPLRALSMRLWPLCRMDLQRRQLMLCRRWQFHLRRQAEQIHRDDLHRIRLPVLACLLNAERVLRIVEIILRAVHRRLMAIDAIAERHKILRDRCLLIRLICLEINHRRKSADRRLCSLEHREFHPLHIDLDEVARLEMIRVDGHQGDFFSLLLAEQGDAAPVVDLLRRELRHMERPGLTADAAAIRIDIRETVDGDIAAEQLIHEPLRLERVDLAARADEPREMHRMRTDIRPGLDDRIALVDQIIEEYRLAAGKLAVELDGLADVGIELVVNELAVAEILNEIKGP